MKWIYKKPKIFPFWVKFKGSEAQKDYYSLTDDGIVCSLRDVKLPYFNHIEMSGFETSSIISYRIDRNKKLELYRFCVFPQIRVIPNETRGSLSCSFKGVDISFGSSVVTDKIKFNGLLTFFQTAGAFEITHTICPAYNKKALIEKFTVKNTGNVSQAIRINNKTPYKYLKKVFFADNKGQTLFTSVCCERRLLKNQKEKINIEPNEEKIFFVCSAAEELTEDQITGQFARRKEFLSRQKGFMKINTPDKLINAMTEFCKIRASESIFSTKNGLMHAPGGGNYYGALWTNDQCEYANPLFAYLGYPAGKEQSINCYKLFSKFADKNKAIPTSIIACGDDIWNGAGDRGDSSMFLYGLGRYLLSTGDREKAVEFLPYIMTAQEYVESKITDEGIVKSDSDELENRFESGKANLSTACITYDAFLSLSYLYRELGKKELSEKALCNADKIKNGIEQYFGAAVEGYDTYRYCEEEKHLRSWICLPLVVGIDNRKQRTVEALLSDKLFTGKGMLTRSGQRTYWDRSLLYSLRGIFYAGEADKAYDLLLKYTKERLLGFHAPYPVEAFPEGNAAQLSAESALYLRIFTEGILGYRPVGFRSFEIKPALPDNWDYFEVKNMELCGKSVDVFIKNGDFYSVKLDDQEISIEKGNKYIFTLNGGKI